jgi:hypothetical protein
MTGKLQFTQASLRRAIKGAQSAGLRVVGIKADGTIIFGDAGTPVIAEGAANSHAGAPSKWEDVEA